jgi:hypothetical protein
MLFNKPKLLIAILACNFRAHHLQACRETWIPDVKARCDYKFFFGRGDHVAQPDEVILDCDDAYRGLACKVQEVCKWALARGYEYVFKVDDDTYVRPERVMHSGFEKYDYVGRLTGPTDEYHKVRYARGGTGYYLSRKVMQVLADAPKPNPDIPKDYAEDSWVGRITLEAGFECIDDPRLRCADFSGPNRGPRPNNSVTWKKDCPTMHNDFITTCEFLGAEMYPVHKEWLATCDAHSDLMGRLRIRDRRIGA